MINFINVKKAFLKKCLFNLLIITIVSTFYSCKENVKKADITIKFKNGYEFDRPPKYGAIVDTNIYLLASQINTIGKYNINGVNIDNLTTDNIDLKSHCSHIKNRIPNAFSYDSIFNNDLLKSMFLKKIGFKTLSKRVRSDSIDIFYEISFPSIENTNTQSNSRKNVTTIGWHPYYFISTYSKLKSFGEFNIGFNASLDLENKYWPVRYSEFLLTEKIFIPSTLSKEGFINIYHVDLNGGFDTISKFDSIKVDTFFNFRNGRAYFYPVETYTDNQLFINGINFQIDKNQQLIKPFHFEEKNLIPRDASNINYVNGNFYYYNKEPFGFLTGENYDVSIYKNQTKIKEINITNAGAIIPNENTIYVIKKDTISNEIILENIE
ncbi:MAG: hypothetical protein CL843_18415 [Crocinitomicaceae bacterium]|nr:hypothetical protein [Crocinitomicaceae bacterium]|tara:strand:- start:4482 stop:5621 length:1140 start_codon:yes stop_codon:yes gene_type:complete